MAEPSGILLRALGGQVDRLTTGAFADEVAGFTATAASSAGRRVRGGRGAVDTGGGSRRSSLSSRRCTAAASAFNSPRLGTSSRAYNSPSSFIVT